jgi:hypothetical protein
MRNREKKLFLVPVGILAPGILCISGTGDISVLALFGSAEASV